MSALFAFLETEIQKMALKETQICRKHKIVWSKGDWLAITTEIETLSRKSGLTEKILGYYAYFLSRQQVNMEEELAEICLQASILKKITFEQALS